MPRKRKTGTRSGGSMAKVNEKFFDMAQEDRTVHCTSLLDVGESVLHQPNSSTTVVKRTKRSKSSVRVVCWKALTVQGR